MIVWYCISLLVEVVGWSAEKMAAEKEYVRKEAMAEEEPNQNVPDNGSASAEMTPRWGPQHAGAKELASQYTFGNTLGHFIFR